MRGKPAPGLKKIGRPPVPEAASTAGISGARNSPNVCYTVAQGKYFVAGTGVQGRWGRSWTDGQPMYVGITTVPKHLLPEKYSQDYTTPLSHTVTEGENSFDIALDAK